MNSAQLINQLIYIFTGVTLHIITLWLKEKRAPVLTCNPFVCKGQTWNCSPNSVIFVKLNESEGDKWIMRPVSWNNWTAVPVLHLPTKSAVCLKIIYENCSLYMSNMTSDLVKPWISFWDFVHNFCWCLHFWNACTPLKKRWIYAACDNSWRALQQTALGVFIQSDKKKSCWIKISSKSFCFSVFLP